MNNIKVRSFSDLILDTVVYGVLTFAAMITLYPFMNVFAVAISDFSAYLENPLMIWPRRINFDAFEHVFVNPLIWSSYRNTVIVAFAGTLIGIFLTTITAYPLAKKDLKGKSVFMSFIIFTMLFNGGMIANFYLIRSLNMLDTLWALILPGSVGAFGIILMKNFFENIPDSLEEAAKIDGASDIYVLFRIVVPLSLPIIATLSLFAMVGHWNAFFNAVLFIRDADNWTLQLLLREIILAADIQMLQAGGDFAEMGHIPVLTLRYATLVVVVLPILCVYPFLQKYFIKGLMLGAVKG